MRFKSSLAAVLTFSLLAMSSLASVCGLSCSFQSFHPACQSATDQKEDPQAGTMPPGMDMSQRSHSGLAEAQADSLPSMVLLNHVSCTHEKCSQTSLSISAAGTDHAKVRTIHSAAINVVHLPVNLFLRADLNSGASPPNLAAISPVFIHLRI